MCVCVCGVRVCANSADVMGVTWCTGKFDLRYSSLRSVTMLANVRCVHVRVKVSTSPIANVTNVCASPLAKVTHKCLHLRSQMSGVFMCV